MTGARDLRFLAPGPRLSQRWGKPGATIAGAGDMDVALQGCRRASNRRSYLMMVLIEEPWRTTL